MTLLHITVKYYENIKKCCNAVTYISTAIDLSVTPVTALILLNVFRYCFRKQMLQLTGLYTLKEENHGF